MYKSTGLRSQIWLSMHSASAMLVMLYAINSVMDSEWSDWVAWQCSVVTCLYHHWIKPSACQVVKLSTTRGFILTILGKFVPDLRLLACNLGRFLFLFLCFFLEDLWSNWVFIFFVIASRYADIKAIRSSLSGSTTLSAVGWCIKWAPHRSRKNEMINAVAPNLVKSISIWIWIHTEGPKADF